MIKQGQSLIILSANMSKVLAVPGNVTAERRAVRHSVINIYVNGKEYDQQGRDGKNISAVSVNRVQLLVPSLTQMIRGQHLNYYLECFQKF